MKNLTAYENFLETQSGIGESDVTMGMEKECAMSPQAMESLKEVCEAMLCKEAEAYHNDADEAHTYEGYVNECMNYIKEAMGHPGYSSLVKPYAE